MLAFRAHSERELITKLQRDGYEKDYVDAVIEYLKEYNLLNDEAYAYSYAENLRKVKKFGKRRIEQELRQKGIPYEIITDAVAELDFDDTEQLCAMVSKKLGGDFERKSIDRAYRYFVSRGYGFDEIRNAIERVKGEFEE